MRLVITSIGTRGADLKQVQDVSGFVRACSSDFDAMTPYLRELREKQKVTNQSLIKIESAAYGLSVRGAEYAHFEDLRLNDNDNTKEQVEDE